jgi:integrase
MTGLKDALEARLVSIDSGSYRDNTELAVTPFVNYLHRNGVDDPDDIDVNNCRTYARELRTRANEGEIAASTAHHYFDVIRAFLSWCVRDGRCGSNPAKREAAIEPLPENLEEPDRQFWTKRERNAILATADRRVDVALENKTIDTDRAYRDRALMYTLTWSGCRGAELVASKRDSQRNGLSWGNVDLQNQTLSVLGKSKRGGSRERQTVPLLTPGVDPLQKWRDQADSDNERAVFPRMDNAAGDPPSSISVHSLSNILEELCEWSQYSFDEPLKAHGARRRLGDDLYQERAELAQKQLRHKSIETTNESYADRQAERQRKAAEEALGLEDDE